MKALVRFIWLVCWLPLAVQAQGVQQAVPLSERNAPYGYYEYLPEGYADAERVPLVIFLHGLGETGDGETDLEKLKMHGPHKMVENGAEFPSVILTPQSVSWWDIAKIGAFVDWAFQNYKIDTTRLYVTGISMGGGGAWLYAVMFPERSAAVVPICGAADPVSEENLVNVPVWAFHNEGDPTVNVELTLGWISGIRAAGGSPKLTIYPVDGHNAWAETYNNDEVWEWMFAQKLGEYEPLDVVENTIVQKIYPNPFQDRLTIQFSGTALSARLFNLNGKIVTEWASLEQKGEMVSITIVPKISPGVYVLELESTSGTERLRVLKE